MQKLALLIVLLCAPWPVYHAILWLFRHGSSSAFDAGVTLTILGLFFWLFGVAILFSRKR